MPETADSTEPYVYYVSYSVYLPFHIKEALTIWLVFGISQLAESLFLCFGAMIEYSKGYWYTSTGKLRQSI